MLTFATLIACLAAANPAPVTGLTTSVRAIDFGDVPGDAVRTRTIEIVNHRSEAISVSRVDADCTCLSGLLPLCSLAPGGRADFTLTLNTCDYVGEVRRTVWLEHDGARLCAIPVRYRVVPPLYADPGFTSLGWIGDGEREATVEIRSTSDLPARLLDVTTSTEDVTAVVLSHTVTRGTPGRIQVTVRGSGLAEPLQATLFVHTDSSAVPVLRIPVHGELAAPLTAGVNVADFGAVALGTESSIELRLAGVAAVRGIRAAGEAVEIADVSRDTAECRVRLRLRPRELLGTFQGFISVDTVAAGESRTLRLPFLGRIVEPPETRRSTSHAAARCCGAWYMRIP